MKRVAGWNLMPKVGAGFSLFVIIALLGCHHSKKPGKKPALTGHVTSAVEGRMEGVLVSAKKEGSRIIVTVVTDDSGSYSFPGDRLSEGNYTLSIRAAGYLLQDSPHAQVTDAGTVVADLQLQKTDDLASQLTSAEWLESVPGNEQEKSKLFRCVACHDLTPVMKSHYDAKSWSATIKQMERWAAPSVLQSPIPSPVPPPPDAPDAKLSAYLASINLNGRKSWPFALKAFARPQGVATHVIITEYDLPGELSLPHDVAVGQQGSIWYNDFQRELVGRLNPLTGETKEWTLPFLRPGFPEGLLTIKIDKYGNAWIPRFFQGCTLVKLDTKTEQMTTWKVPEEFDGPQSRCGHVALGAPDGTVWMSDSGGRKMFRLHPDTGKFDVFDSFPGYVADNKATAIETAGRKSKGHRTYGIGVDSAGNGYFADIAGGTIGRLDAKTGEVILYPTPTPDSGPRRTFMDREDKYWFGENYVSKLGMFDTKTRTFKEWTPPTPWSGAYPAVRDKTGDVWTVGMSTDYVYRLNPGTGVFTEYLLPTLSANMRRVDVDNSTTPVTIWVAEVHRGRLAKIEPLPNQ
jgi:streptogramin lyase